MQGQFAGNRFSVVETLLLANFIPSVSNVFMQLDGIDHVALAVRDVERSAQWYVDVLGFERRHADVWGDVPTFIGKGDTALALFPAKTASTSLAAATSAKLTSSGNEIRMLHLAFRANRTNFQGAQEELKRRGVRFEFEDHEIAHSVYFKDPDGHNLEITTYEI